MQSNASIGVSSQQCSGCDMSFTASMAEATKNDKLVCSIKSIEHGILNHFCTSTFLSALSIVGRLHVHQAFACIPDERCEDTRIPSP